MMYKTLVRLSGLLDTLVALIAVFSLFHSYAMSGLWPSDPPFSLFDYAYYYFFPAALLIMSLVTAYAEFTLKNWLPRISVVAFLTRVLGMYFPWYAYYSVEYPIAGLKDLFTNSNGYGYLCNASVLLLDICRVAVLLRKSPSR